MATVKAEDFTTGTIFYFLGIDGSNIATKQGATEFAPTAGDFYYYDGATTVGKQAASTTDALTGTEATKPLTADALAALWEKASDVASASTVTFGDGGYFHVTGTTGVTAFALTTAHNGREITVVFDGALTITHNATSLILPTGANITTAAGDTARLRFETSANVRMVSFQRKDGSALTGSSSIPFVAASASGPATLAFAEDTDNGTNKVTVQSAAALSGDVIATLPSTTCTILGTSDIGIEHWYVPVGYMRPAITSGAAYGVTNAGSNQPDYQTLDFDTGSDEFAWFDILMPERWNGGTVKQASVWTAASGSGTVAIGLSGVALGDNGALATALGTRQTSSDTLQTATNVHIGPLSSAITIANSPAGGKIVYYRVSRDTANDTLGVDARLIGLILEITVTALKDA